MAKGKRGGNTSLGGASSKTLKSKQGMGGGKLPKKVKPGGGQ